MRAAGGAGRPAVVRGDVVLVPFPFTDLTTSKLRPAVVVCSSHDQTDFVLAFVGSRGAIRAAGEVAVAPSHPEFGLTGFAVASTIRVAKIVTLSRSLLVRRIGRLGPLLIADMDQALADALGIDTSPYRDAGRRAERVRLRALAVAGGAVAVLDDLGAGN